VARVFREFGHGPVDRGSPHVAASTIDTGVALFAAGKAVGIYPEGTRSPHGRLHKFRTGLARLARAPARRSSRSAGRHRPDAPSTSRPPMRPTEREALRL
jgi:1-acyl-sn-glycerol-3-phosphate acyltransferase